MDEESKKKAIITFIVVIVILIVGVSVYFYLDDKKKKEEEKKKKEKEEKEEEEKEKEAEAEKEKNKILKSNLNSSNTQTSNTQTSNTQTSNTQAPAVVVDVPATMRTSSRPAGQDRDTMKAHNTGRLAGNLWAADVAEIGKWYQMDNGKTASIVGVAIMGRAPGPDTQYVKTFKVKYYDANTWKDVDAGATFTGNTDMTTKVEVKFATPVNTRYIRIYPQTWEGHMSLRAGLITNSTNDGSTSELLNIAPAKRTASSQWDDVTWPPGNGTLNNASGWHIANGTDPTTSPQWYEMSMDTAKKVTGVAIQGRGLGNDPAVEWNWQWIQSFKVDYKNSSGAWTPVDNGFIFSGPGDKDSIVWALFETPVNTTGIRVYPKTWDGWMSGRFDLLGEKAGASTTSTYMIEDDDDYGGFARF